MVPLEVTVGLKCKGNKKGRGKGSPEPRGSPADMSATKFMHAKITPRWVAEGSSLLYFLLQSTLVFQGLHVNRQEMGS